MGSFGIPPDCVAWAALWTALAWSIAVTSARVRHAAERMCRNRQRWLLASLAILAAIASAGYVHYYLRGGPRIIDAAAYWLQARTFASGHITLPVILPTASLRGRFLYFDPATSHLSSIFPPGYPLFLSLGFLFGHPMLMGPLLAAALVLATAALARRITHRSDVAVFAGLLSVLCVTLRYHTADTMSHGFSALLFTLAVYGAYGTSRGSTVLAGLSVGLLFATRPVTAGVAFVVAGMILAERRPASSSGHGPPLRRWRVVSMLALSTVPGILLWLGYQRACTGSAWHPAQLAYYSVADGPPGCFRYGFGSNIGCRFEHGQYVANRLKNGFGLLEAGWVTLIRLRWHALDVLDTEILAPVVVLSLWSAAKRTLTRPVTLAVVGVVLAYVPFYFDGSYPGGGARLFADVLPLEHVLVASWVLQRAWHRYLVPVALAGFALHGSFQQRLLAERDGGRPMYQPAELEQRGIARGLVYVGTDHGFLIGHDPDITDPRTGVVVVRARGDATDCVLYERLGRPTSYRYLFDPTQADAMPSIEPWVPCRAPDTLRFEGEATWPPVSVSKGWVMPVYPTVGHASSGRALAIEPTSGRSDVSLVFGPLQAGHYDLSLHWLVSRSGKQDVLADVAGTELSIVGSAPAGRSLTSHRELKLSSNGELQLRIRTGRSGILLDYFEIRSTNLGN